jgi:hypothetical protein
VRLLISRKRKWVFAPSDGGAHMPTILGFSDSTYPSKVSARCCGVEINYVSMALIKKYQHNRKIVSSIFM